MDKKDFIYAINKDAERRFYEITSANVEVRSVENNAPEIFGYGAVFNSESRVMRSMRGQQFVERILPGAFDHLLDDPNIVSLFNHEPDYPLARNKRSMTIGADEYGLWYRFNPPNSPMGQNITESIRRGDVVGSSFSFIVADEKNEHWEMRKGQPALRTIKKFDMVIDLGPVTFETYPAATVSARSFKALDEIPYELSEAAFKIAQRKRANKK